MGDAAKVLQTETEAAPDGVLSAARIRELVKARIQSVTPIDEEGQIQPASMDLRLGNKAYRLRASFLPGHQFKVTERLRTISIHELDISGGAVLETGAVYLVPLQEAVYLDNDISASTNPKSSTGRLDVFTRVITDYGTEFDQVPAGYHGPLYLEICPRTFPIMVRPGSRLSQIRFRRGNCIIGDDELRGLHGAEKLVDSGVNISGGLGLGVDLHGFGDDVVGYRARRHTGAIDVDKVAGYLVEDFWDPVIVRRGRPLILEPDEFYILASREAVHVPPTHAAEMVAFNPLVGEFRAHYAGFFDPGFGSWTEKNGLGSRAVLEVRSHDVPFIIEHGQIVCRLVYERLTEAPECLYGEGIGSNYQGQALKLSKHFLPA